MEIADHGLTRMDRYGDRFARRNGKWVKITRQSDGRYTVVRGWKGDIKATIGGTTRNVRYYGWAKDWANNWLDDK